MERVVVHPAKWRIEFEDWKSLDKVLHKSGAWILNTRVLRVISWYFYDLTSPHKEKEGRLEGGEIDEKELPQRPTKRRKVEAESPVWSTIRSKVSTDAFSNKSDERNPSVFSGPLDKPNVKLANKWSSCQFNNPPLNIADPHGPISVLWDFEQIKFSMKDTPTLSSNDLFRSFAKNLYDFFNTRYSLQNFICLGRFSFFSDERVMALTDAGIAVHDTFTEVSHSKHNASIALIVQITKIIHKNKPPHTIVVISNDPNLVPTLSFLRSQLFKIVLVRPTSHDRIAKPSSKQSKPRGTDDPFANVADALLSWEEFMPRMTSSTEKVHGQEEEFAWNDWERATDSIWSQGDTDHTGFPTPIAAAAMTSELAKPNELSLNRTSLKTNSDHLTPSKVPVVIDIVDD